jgi:hypothetical protein
MRAFLLGFGLSLAVTFLGAAAAGYWPPDALIVRAAP